MILAVVDGSALACVEVGFSLKCRTKIMVADAFLYQTHTCVEREKILAVKVLLVTGNGGGTRRRSRE